MTTGKFSSSQKCSEELPPCFGCIRAIPRQESEDYHWWDPGLEINNKYIIHAHTRKYMYESNWKTGKHSNPIDKNMEEHQLLCMVPNVIKSFRADMAWTDRSCTHTAENACFSQLITASIEAGAGLPGSMEGWRSPPPSRWRLVSGDIS